MVDGKPGQVRRANHFYQAVQLDSGEQTGDFFYESEGFKQGLLISLGVLIIVLGGTAGGFFR